ncbi:hypothetical protein [Persephonella sp.]
MRFKKFEEHYPHRFKEFDEARVYIENMTLDFQLTLEAVDYMSTHKQYTFLLENLLRQFFHEGGNSQLFDYVFSKLSDCPKRKEDLHLYIQILTSPNPALKKSFIGYLKTCREKLYPFVLDLLKNKDPEHRKLAVCILKYLPDENIKKAVISHLKTESNVEVIEEILLFLRMYASPEEIDCLNFLKEKFPQIEKTIDTIIKELKS